MISLLSKVHTICRAVRFMINKRQVIYVTSQVSKLKCKGFESCSLSKYFYTKAGIEIMKNSKCSWEKLGEAHMRMI